MIRIPAAQVWSARTYKWVCAVATVLALAAGAGALALPWQPHTDFDIIGFLFVIQNLPRMLLSFTTVVCALVAVASCVRWLMGGDTPPPAR